MERNMLRAPLIKTAALLAVVSLLSILQLRPPKGAFGAHLERY